MSIKTDIIPKRHFTFQSDSSMRLKGHINTTTCMIGHCFQEITR